ncbi:iron-sulfur cluster co-chaperone protein HscB homolog [Rutidosis leptorrhynchoides]|uniref:iron-sulfur cluster co-chaperone protein HscB homolog n=1 Tax=Rutidosis leptorrhynchoides TaxID=125765 RepID=UPI003A99D38A
MRRNQLITTPLSTFIRKTLNPKSVSIESIQENITQFQIPPKFSTLSGFNPTQQIRFPINPQIHFIWNSNLCSSVSSNETNSCCWNCNNQRPFLICESCGSIQPADHSIDYFKIFGLERKFDIDDGSLEGTYKSWQKKLHPDLVHTKSKEEREYAAEQSARVIDAYTTLRKPLKRAIYVMSLEGIEVDEEQTVSEPELLGEIMEIREAVEEANDSQALNKIHSEMEVKLRRWFDSFANAFKSKEYDEALKAIQRMTYYHRVNEEIVKKL